MQGVPPSSSNAPFSLMSEWPCAEIRSTTICRPSLNKAVKSHRFPSALPASFSARTKRSSSVAMRCTSSPADCSCFNQAFSEPVVDRAGRSPVPGFAVIWVGCREVSVRGDPVDCAADAGFPAASARLGSSNRRRRRGVAGRCGGGQRRRRRAIWRLPAVSGESSSPVTRPVFPTQVAAKGRFNR